VIRVGRGSAPAVDPPPSGSTTRPPRSLRPCLLGLTVVALGLATICEAQPQRPPPVRAGTERVLLTRADEPPIPDSTIRVRIRYAQDLGYTTTGPVPGDSINSCGVFDVSATAMSGAPGTFGRETDVAKMIVRHAPMRRDGRFYVCDFDLSGWHDVEMPFDQPITVVASVRPDHGVSTWRGGRTPTPPATYRRALNHAGRRVVRLTARQPRAVVDFEMTYVRTGRPEVWVDPGRPRIEPRP
jgi:hypothetical protein